MSEYIISTDSVCDLPQSFYDENGIIYAHYHYSLDNKEYIENAGDEKAAKEFYATLRNGGTPATAQVNIEEYKALFEPVLKQGKDILHLGFSSGLSGSLQSAKIAAEDLLETYPNNRVVVVDSLSAAPGFGLFVSYVTAKKKEGYILDDLKNWAEKNRLNIVHWFTVDDLFFLKKGGRINTATAVVGSMLAIKPVLHVDNEGHLINMAKARGRQMSLKMLVDKMAQTVLSPEKQTVFIGHGDCLKDAQYVESLVKQLYPAIKTKIYYIGATIGAHSGPGTVALFYYGSER